MKRIWTVFACLLLVAGCATATEDKPVVQDPLAVNASTGTLQGTTVGGTRQFLGVRYAQAPTGDSRWALPQPVPESDETVDATQYGARCPQGAGADIQTDEDCLFLNVVVPEGAGDEPLPVVVWWHGGGFTAGAGSDYDATRFAEQGKVIVVTVNYRLGMLGYLGLPDLEGSGNFGLADQLLALKWANDNAAAFGGDPDNVTVMGESAGGMSACAALGSPAAEGLIDKAILMSGSCLIDWPDNTFYPGTPNVTPYTAIADSETTGTSVAADLGCSDDDTIACLRELPVEPLLAQSGWYGNGLAFGTDLLPQNPADALRNGEVLPVPVISGGTKNEHRSFVGGAVLADPSVLTEGNYSEMLEKSFGAEAGVVEERYPLSAYGSAPLAWATMVTDVAWACPTLRGAGVLAQKADVWSYEFADDTASDVSNVSASGLVQGAAHATDVPYTFDVGAKDLLTGPGQKELASTMIGAWSDFARSGNPSEAWPRTVDATGPVVEFGNPTVTVGDYFDAHQCGFWNAR